MENKMNEEKRTVLKCFDKVDQTLSGCSMSLMLYNFSQEPASVVCLSCWMEILSRQMDELFRAVRNSWGITED